MTNHRKQPRRRGPDDWADDPEARAYLDHARKTLPHLVGDATMSVALMPEDGQPDPKFCIELGYMIMLDKPIIAVVRHGAKVPDKLVLIADEIVEWDGSPDSRPMQEAIERIAAKLKAKDR